MNFKQYFKTAFVVAISALTVSSCVNKDDWDTPPINCNNKFDAPNITMAAFKALAPASGFVLITEDKIFDGYIVSSDENGNFYKTISFRINQKIQLQVCKWRLIEQVTTLISQ